MEKVVLVLVEVLIVIGLSRLVGLVFRWIDQPLVIGEIVAGIMLGPSLLGFIAPDTAAILFPVETLPFLNMLSQVGLIFFMFLIGLELNPKYLRGNLDVAVVVSGVSIIVPFGLATLASLILYPLVSSGGVPFTAFAMFLGAAMSITAFPVLARIITENNLQGTRLGTLALTSAAVDDVTAWCLLAVAIAVARTGNFVAALPTIGASIIYIGLMVTVGRWSLRYLAMYYRRVGRLNQLVLALIYIGVVASALITEYIGIHLIFGAFLLGAIMPKNAGLVKELAIKTEDFVLIFLLPIFFAHSGLRTQIGLLNRPELWLLCVLVLAVAIAGKFIGSYIAARVSGVEHREASALGWLMNTRGLTELIVLNIGLELKVISPLLFTMLVIMALVTTFMTSPLLELTYPKHLLRLDAIEPEPETTSPSTTSPYRILVPIANPVTQVRLIEIAVKVAVNKHLPGIVNPLSLVELPEDYQFESTPIEADKLVAQRYQELEQSIAHFDPHTHKSVHPIVRISNHVAKETNDIANLEQADLIIVGWHRSAFIKNRLGGRVGQILANTKIDVAVYVDRGQERLENILVPYLGNMHDDLGVVLALRILVNSNTCNLQILNFTVGDRDDNKLSYQLRTIMAELPQNVRDRISIKTVIANEPIPTVVDASNRADLTIIGISHTWGIEHQTLGHYTDELAIRCRSSLLITRCHSRVTSHFTPVLSELTSR